MANFSPPLPSYTFGPPIIGQACDLRIDEIRGRAIATIMAAKGAGNAEIGARIGVEPPDGPSWVTSNDIGLVGTGPGAWLAMTDNPAVNWPATLSERLTGLATVSDQSGGYTLLRLKGSQARTLLSRGAYIDFHQESFCPGTAAVTVIAHMGVILWLRDATPTFEIALFRSYTASFRHWLDVTVASLSPLPTI